MPALDANVNPPIVADGHSHFPIFFADGAAFGPPGTKLIGNYMYRMDMIDRTGNGWHIDATFAVGP